MSKNKPVIPIIQESRYSSVSPYPIGFPPSCIISIIFMLTSWMFWVVPTVISLLPLSGDFPLPHGFRITSSCLLCRGLGRLLHSWHNAAAILSRLPVASAVFPNTVVSSPHPAAPSAVRTVLGITELATHEYLITWLSWSRWRCSDYYSRRPSSPPLSWIALHRWCMVD